MAKQLITDYTFNASTGEVTLTGLTALRLEQVLLITNVTTNTIIYNFASPALGGTVVGTTITLDYNTSAMSGTDSLQILIDAEDETQTDIAELAEATYETARGISSLAAMRGTSGQLRVGIVTGSVGIASDQTLGTVTTVGNIGQMGGLPLTPLVYAQTNSGAYQGNINNVIIT